MPKPYPHEFRDDVVRVARNRQEGWEELRVAIVTWIERTHHQRRRQARLGRLTPVEYEAIMTPPASQAA